MNEAALDSRTRRWRDALIRIAGIMRQCRDWLPLFLAIGFTLLVQFFFQTPLLPVLWYLAVFVFVVSGPGLLVYRAAIGTRGSVVADLAIGTGIGLVLQIGFWVVAVSLGHGLWVPLGALAIYIVFGAIPRLRRFWRISGEDRDPLPPVILWAAAGIYCLSLVINGGSFSMALPPEANQWYVDEYWHLGNAAWLLNHVNLADVRVAGEPLNYHWFSSAHVAAQTLSTNLDLNLVAARLWTIPIYAATVLMTVVVGRQLTRSWWSGTIAALLMVAIAQIRTSAIGLADGNALTVHSPSQTYSVITFLLIVSILASMWNQGWLNWRAWGVLAVGFCFAPLAKSSLLPVIICGLALALINDVLRRRNWRASAIAFGLSVSALAASFLLPGGGAGGSESGIQLFSTLRQNPFYVERLDLDPIQRQFSSSLLPPGLISRTGLSTVAVLLLLYVARYAWLLAAVPVLGRQRMSSTAWFLFGCGFSGFVAMFLINHPGMSQLYFFRGGLVGWYLLAGWGLVESWRRCGPSEARRISLVGCFAGVGYLALWYAVASQGPLFTQRPIFSVLIDSLAVLGPVGLVIVVGRRWVVRRHAVQLFLAAALTAAAVVPTAANLRLPEVPTGDQWAVSAPESAAALWLRDNSAVDDVVATNVHCRAVVAERCDRRAFWVSGLTQRQIYIEGWAYTTGVRAGHGYNNEWSGAQPFRDQARLKLNDAAFSQPTAAVISSLKSQGVRWLFADNRRGEASASLTEWADAVFSNDEVTIYRIN